jgi:predicted PurR-regulated permease PerM
VGDHTIHHKTPDTGATLTRVAVTAPLPQRRWLAPVSYALAAAALLAVLWLHLLVCLLAGLLVYESVQSVAPLLERRLSNQRARIAVVFLLSVAVVGAITGSIVLGAAHFNKHDIPSIERLLGRLLQLADAIRANLPAWAIDYVPDDVARIRDQAGSWISGHMVQIQIAGHAALRGFVHLVIGLVLGAFIAITTIEASPQRPLAAALMARIRRFSLAFRRIVFAQFKISALNTAFTAAYLLIVLPLLHMRLPLSKSMVVLTFIVGLLPVVGNLISNTVIVLVSLSVSVPAALGSLIFLVLIHKLEYFLNARIVGGEIEAKTWELLLAMVVMEAAFGIQGVVAAPIYYAYLKLELRAAKLI